MYKGLRICAIVVAGGKGKRMGADVNKQYLIIHGRPILAHTLSVFDSIDLVDDVIVVTGEHEIEHCRENVVLGYGIKKVSNIVAGGSERQYSVLNGLRALEGLCDIVIVHDGARPFVTPDIIEKSVEEAFINSAAACAVSVKDTIKIADCNGFITATPDRSLLYAVQTPQTFMYTLLYNSHLAAVNEGFLGTDDTVLVERSGTRVKLFEGSYENIKITTPEDIYIAEAIIEYRHERSNTE